jgi:hypothetical protein
MSERRMNAYYYDFETTKNAAIDKILGAVACAGKAYHHTQDWRDETEPPDDHTGETPAEWIQNAAIEAADEIERLREALEDISKIPRSENAYGIIQVFARAALEEGKK